MPVTTAETRLGRVAARFSSPADCWMAARALCWACVLPVLKRVMPLPSLARLAWHAPRHSLRDAGREDQALTFARWACRLVRWTSGGNCLERGLIAYRLLGEASATPTLVIGVAHDGPGRVRGHAWVLLDGALAGESHASIQEYTPILAFGPDATLVPPPGQFSSALT